MPSYQQQPMNIKKAGIFIKDPAEFESNHKKASLLPV